MEVRELTGPMARPPLTRLTPIAENLILLRHVEELGQLQRLVSVMKLRDGAFDMRLRRFSIGPGGIVLEDADTGGRQAMEATRMAAARKPDSGI